MKEARNNIKEFNLFVIFYHYASPFKFLEYEKIITDKDIIS